MVRYQDILRLQISMIDPNGVAKFNGIQNLQKRTLGEEIIAHKLALLGDVGEQVTFGTKLKHDKGTVV